MKSGNILKTINLTIIFTFAFVGIAGAGPIIKRDTGGQDRSKDTQQKVTRQAEHSSDSRSVDARPSKERNSSEERHSTSNSSSSASRTSSSDSSSRATMKDRSIDATPSQSKSDSRSTYKNRNNDSRDDHNRYKDKRDDSKYNRVDERDTNKYRYDKRDYWKHHHAPSYRSGHYYYDYGWPYYYDHPLSYGYWAFEYDRDYSRPSIYFYYGYFPYVSYDRVIVIDRHKIKYIEVPIDFYENYPGGGYYLSERDSDSLDSMLYNIRGAWTTQKPNLLLRYVKSNTDIDVNFDGKYSYSLDGSDYADMTRDAIESTRTINFEFTSVRTRGDDRIVAYGKHRFCTLDGWTKTVYISYELERHDGEWIITEVGSSLKKLS